MLKIAKKQKTNKKTASCSKHHFPYCIIPLFYWLVFLPFAQYSPEEPVYDP